jgi:signal transduction histidine kinase
MVLLFLAFKTKSRLSLQLENKNMLIEERSDQLTVANRVKDRLLSVVSHDIKGPLNSLHGILGIYNSGFINPDEFKTYTKYIEDDLSKTSLLVDNILSWTSIQLKGTVINKEEIDLGDLLIENIELFKTIASNKKLSIKSDLAENRIVVFDKNILNLILRNLISNAIKFSFEGGEILISSRNSEGQSLIQVTDAGVGMSEEAVRSLQESENRKSSVGTGGEKGTGLGLSFCREYLQLAGGELKIQSTIGNGSTFTIVLPK